MKNLFISLLLCSSFLKSYSQTSIMVSIVRNNLVYHSLASGEIKYVPLSSNIFSSEAPRSMDYNPDDCIYYVVTNFQSSPKLYTITHNGIVNLVGTITSNDGRSFYACEAIAYSEYNKKTYISISYPSRDYFTETIAEIDVGTAVFTAVTTINTSLPLDSDADFMECYDSLLIISDGNSSPTYSTIFSINLNNITPTSVPTSEYYSTTFINYQEITIIDDKVYVEESKKLYEMDLTATNKTFNHIQNINYTGYNGTIKALTSFNHDEIFDVFHLQNDSVICEGDSIKVSPSKYSQFVWYDGSNGDKQIKDSGSYFGYIQFGTCTFTTDTFNIELRPCDTCKRHIEQIDTNKLLDVHNTTLCDTDSIKIGLPIIPNWQITWNNGSTLDSIIVRTSGNYSATYTYGDCSFQTKVVNIEFVNCDSCQGKMMELLDLFSGLMDVSLCKGDSFIFNLPHYVDSVIWSLGANDLQLNVKESTSFQGLLYLDTCLFETPNFKVTFYSCETCDPYLPNAFTPDKDELNEEFKPIFPTDCFYKIENFRVYNRWGEQIHESNTGIWDGYYQGVISQIDVYFYILTVNYPSENRTSRYVGNVHLMR